jgi:hypothetical protein
MNHILVCRLFWKFFYIRYPLFLSNTCSREKIEMKNPCVE